jgi:hypothetical protein
MQLAGKAHNRDRTADLGTLTAAIARSPIVVAEPIPCLVRLPDGFGRADRVILDWICAEGRRRGGGLARM